MNCQNQNLNQPKANIAIINGSSSTEAVMKGIDPSKGRPNLDFNPSSQEGFYVTNDLA
ncbi:hypothetical protein ACWGOQ_0019435 [Aquimarina sp. M1]